MLTSTPPGYGKVPAPEPAACDRPRCCSLGHCYETSAFTSSWLCMSHLRYPNVLADANKPTLSSIDADISAGVLQASPTRASLLPKAAVQLAFRRTLLTNPTSPSSPTSMRALSVPSFACSSSMREVRLFRKLSCTRNSFGAPNNHYLKP